MNSSDVVNHREAIGLRKGSLAASLEGAIRLLEIAARYRDLLSAKDRELLTQASDTIRGIEQWRQEDAMNDDKLSLTELHVVHEDAAKSVCFGVGADAAYVAVMHSAMPVLLEIADAAANFALIQETCEPSEFAQAEFDKLWSALARIRR